MVAGSVALLAAVAVGVVSAVFAIRTMPLGILTLGGEPGRDVLAVVDAPGTGTLTLEADTDYGLLLVVPSSQAPGWLDGNLTVTGPGAEEIAVTSGSSVNLTVASGGQSGRVVGAVRPNASGAHELTVPPAGQGTGRVFVTELPETGTLVTGIFGGVLGFIAAVFLGIAGVGMLCGGLIWRTLRKRSAPPPAPQSAVAPPLY